MSAYLTAVLARGDCLIIVPPFAGLDRPSLAAHLLQACAQQDGATVRVLYANIMLAAVIGEEPYEAICYAPTANLLGERLLSRAAYGNQPLGRDQDGSAPFAAVWKQFGPQVSSTALIQMEALCHDWVDHLAVEVARLGFPVVGCSTTFEQTAASIAILNRIKIHRPQTITILGGANCDGEQADGIHSLAARIDFVFSGESESTFPRFLRGARDRRLPSTRTIHGEPVVDMDGIPPPDFSEFYEQYDRFLPEGEFGKKGDLWLPYETSRGCWWGEKHHCTFCGVNGSIMKFREKSPERVVKDLKELTAKHPTNRVVMYDNIMPHSYFRSLLPRLATELPGLHIFYEQKANLTLERFQILKRAGIAEIQPGIEALSTSLLKRMCKGVTASQNVALLRYARSFDITLRWNLLYAFPGDQLLEYEATLKLLPLLRHLEPPSGVFHLSIDRFSPYFDRPSHYGISNLRPMKAYQAILPAHADLWKSSYHFIGHYDSESKPTPAVMRQIKTEVRQWQGGWKSAADLPALAVTDIADDTFLLLDTRELPDTEVFNIIDEATARVVLAGHRGESTAAVQWALDHKAAVMLDSTIVPLATASPDLIAGFEGSRLQISADENGPKQLAHIQY
jgi:ribosomal peptide maturation radical SAM protein 1